MNQAGPARPEYGNPRTPKFFLSQTKEDPDDELCIAVARILCCSKDAFEKAQLSQATPNSKYDPFSEAFRAEFSKQLGALAPEEFNRFPEGGPELGVFDEYLKVIAGLNVQWRNCDADAKSWLSCPGTKQTAEELEMVRRKIRRVETRPEDLDFAPPNWPENSFVPGFDPRRPYELEGLSDWCRRRTPEFKRKIIGQRSWLEVARIAALARFDETLSGRDGIAYCKWCKKIFSTFYQSTFCSEKCAHRDSSRRSKRGKTRMQNQRRMMIATQATNRWLEKPRREWRPAVEMALARAGLAAPHRRSQWLGRCIVAAKLPSGHPKRIRLAELCTSEDADEQLARTARAQLDLLLSLINRASQVERDVAQKYGKSKEPLKPSILDCCR